jgi:hypothetical protein
MSCLRLPGFLLLAALAQTAHGATLRVGHGEEFASIAEAARAARDGDTVEIMSGLYLGDVAVWSQRLLTIRGIGTRPVLNADGRDAEGKAIWVIRNGDFTIENIEFRGARVSSGNGAGIRFEGGKLTLRNCSFVDNQMGILTGHDPASELVIENCRFADAPRQTSPLPHLLYVGKIARFSLTRSRFTNGYQGHLVKSRARLNSIMDNNIVDGPDGEASYELDLPNGGIARIERNTIGQSARSPNHAIISYGSEGDTWPDSALTLTGNTLINERQAGGWFLRVHATKFPAPPVVRLLNNRSIGPGVFETGLPEAAGIR